MPNKKSWPQQGPFLFLVAVYFIVQMALFVLSRPCFGTLLETETGPTVGSLEELATLDMLQSDPKASVLALAEARLKQGLWEESARYAIGALSMDPDNIKAHGVLGTIYALTGQKGMAQNELAFLKGSGDKSFFPDLINAIFRAQEGEFREAEQLLRSALKKDPAHTVAIYYSGSLNLAQDKLQGAEEAFKAVLASQPDFIPALAGLGQVYLRQKKMKEAADYYQKAVKNEPENLIYRKQLVEIYKATGRKEAANKEIKEALYYTPGVKQSYLTRGMELLSEGSYREAIELMDKTLGIYKRIPEALYIKAAAQINLKETKSALKNIQSFVSEQWAYPQAHHYAGMCYLALEDIDKAESQFKTVISINPRMGRSFVPLTIIEQLRGNHDRALEGLRLAISGGEPPAFIHYLSAHILLAKGEKTGYQEKMKVAAGLIPGLDQNADFIVPKEKERPGFAKERNLMVLYFYNAWYGKAIDTGNKLLELDKHDRFAWYYKALSEIVRKNSKSAVHAFEQLITIEPGLLGAHMGLGRLYMAANDYPKALSSFIKVIELDSGYAPAHVALGDVSLRTQREQDAIRCYEKAVALAPKAPGAYQKLALILSEKPDKRDEALRLATTAVELAPEDPFSLDTLGWVYAQRGEYEQAIQKLNEASRRLPREPIIQYHLGVAHYENKNLKEAKKALETALLISKSFRDVEHALKILDKISK